MATIRDQIAEELSSGRARKRLLADCLEWRLHMGAYAVNNVVRLCAEEGLSVQLYDSIMDQLLRQRRREHAGANGVREDIERSLRYFGLQEPDVLKYLKIRFAEPSFGDASGVEIHATHCRDFLSFLQLDTPVDSRVGVGVHKVLTKIFPMQLGPQNDGYERTPEEYWPMAVLTGYRIGDWQCECGNLRGERLRHTFRCKCGDPLETSPAEQRLNECRECGTLLTPLRCSECGSGVGLEVINRHRRSTVHPAEFRVPLLLDLQITHPKGNVESLSLELMRIPLLLGFDERDGRFQCGLPSLFWLQHDGDASLDYSSGELLVLDDSPRYDRQTTALGILEAALRRTLAPTGRDYRQSLRSKLASTLAQRHRQLEDLSPYFTRRFEIRLIRALGARRDSGRRPLRFTDYSRECVLASAPSLRGGMAYVSRRVAEPGTLTGAQIENVSVSIEASELGNDQLTPTPPDHAEGASHLQSDGLVLPGEVLQPGEVLAGVIAHVSPDDLTPEKRLLNAIFGRRMDSELEDQSLLLHGRRSATVLAQNIDIQSREIEVTEAPGRLTRRNRRLPEGDLAQVSMTLAREVPLEAGDVLTGEDGGQAVVCRILGDDALRAHAGTDFDIDVVVAEDHPWINDKSQGPVSRHRLALAGSEPIEADCMARETGAYSLRTERPLKADDVQGGAQVLRSRALQRILSKGGYKLGRELFLARSDCAEDRLDLYRSQVALEKSTSALAPQSAHEGTRLMASRSGTTAYWGRLFAAAGISIRVIEGQMKFGLLSDDEVRMASYGPVRSGETLNYKNAQPVKGGLFCQAVFGPLVGQQCACGKFKKDRHTSRDVEACDRCDVDLVEASVRRERFGHIDLSAPVLHPWATRNDHSLICRLVERGYDEVDELIREVRHLVVDGDGSTLLREGETVSEQVKDELEAKSSSLVTVTGVDAIEKLLQESGRSKNLILRSLAVLPPDLRPMIQLGSGQWATSDLNALYQEVIRANSRLDRLTGLGAPKVILDNEASLLRAAVAALFDNEGNDGPVKDRNGRALLSLEGHLRELTANGSLLDALMTKPVDYSASTRLVASSTGGVDECRLFIDTAWTLFRPSVIGELIRRGSASNMAAARRQVDRRTAAARSALDAVCEVSHVLIQLGDRSPWPLVAARPILSADLPISLHTDVIDHLGWDELGRKVSIFVVLTEDANNEAARFLPTVLAAEEMNGLRDDSQTQPLAFDISGEDLVDLVLMRAAHRSSIPMQPMDWLIAGEVGDQSE